MVKERIEALIRNKENAVLGPYDYFALVAPDQWRVVNSVPLRGMLLTDEEEVRDTVMSLRLGTGIIGELDCPSGDADYAPRNRNEVVIGIGRMGIEALLNLSAQPCITCHSGRRLVRLAPESLKKTLKGNLDLADDKGFLLGQYDARQLDWHQITHLGIAPSRLYTKAGLPPENVTEAAKPFIQAGVPVPAIGYYDITKKEKDKFRPYAEC